MGARGWPTRPGSSTPPTPSSSGRSCRSWSGSSKIGEAGFTRYEFGRWKTKELDAIAKKNEELGLQAVLFHRLSGALRGSKWKEGLLEAAADAAELAPKLGTTKVGVIAADRDEKLDRHEQVERPGRTP